jgi:DNA-binding response OmpR family regulator
MSGYTEQDASARFRGLGLAAFVQKPFESDSLVVALRAALERPSKRAPSPRSKDVARARRRAT